MPLHVVLSTPSQHATRFGGTDASFCVSINTLHKHPGTGSYATPQYPPELTQAPVVLCLPNSLPEPMHAGNCASIHTRSSLALNRCIYHRHQRSQRLHSRPISPRARNSMRAPRYSKTLYIPFSFHLYTQTLDQIGTSRILMDFIMSLVSQLYTILIQSRCPNAKHSVKQAQNGILTIQAFFE